LLGLVFRLVSQPLALLPSQLPQPALQAPIWQVPELQSAEALAKEQGVPQAPQLVSVFRGVSQPLALLPSQLP
jgi:hypothetical protein